MNPPTFAPDRVGHRRMQVWGGSTERLLHSVPQSGSDCVLGQQPARLPGASPLQAVGLQAAAGHDEMQVRVELQLASPGMHQAFAYRNMAGTDHSQHCVEVARCRCGRALLRPQVRGSPSGPRGCRLNTGPDMRAAPTRRADRSSLSCRIRPSCAAGRRSS